MHITDDSKVPTTLLYSNIYQDPNWGHEAPVEEDPIRWFKLLLLKDEDIPEDVRNSEYLHEARVKLKAEGLQPIDAVTDYLSMLWKHAMASIKRARGSAVDGTPFKVVITVPAIWKPYAKEKMKKAAKNAGILDYRIAGETTLNFVDEPEAAALSSLKECAGDIRVSTTVEFYPLANGSLERRCVRHM